jgi:hypothetical protein
MRKIMNAPWVFDGFDSGKLSSIWSPEKLAAGALEFQSDIVRSGKGAAKITIHEGDNFEFGGKNKDKPTERDELFEAENLWSFEGKAYRYQFSIFLPSDFPIVPTRLVLAQWKQKEENEGVRVNNPVLALRYANGSLSLTLQTNEERQILYRTHKDVRGKWLDFEFETRFDRTNRGFIKGTLNGKKRVEYAGRTAYSETQGYPPLGRFYFKMGLYRDKLKQPMSVYLGGYSKWAI